MATTSKQEQRRSRFEDRWNARQAEAEADAEREARDEEYRARQSQREERRSQQQEQRRDEGSETGWDRAGRHFKTRAQSRWDARAKEQEATRKRMNASEALSDREEVSLLRSNIQAAGKDYMQSLRRSDVLVAGFEDEQKDETVTALNNVYAQMMVSACVRPLQRGVNTASVVRAASMMAAMYMVSPTFQDAVGEHLKPVKESLKKRMDTRTENKLPGAQMQAELSNSRIAAKNEKIRASNVEREARGEKAKPLLKEKQATDFLNKKWAKRYEDIQFRKRGNREMFTERSAGMTEVALMESAYLKMRTPGVDPERIRQSHRALVDKLYAHAAEDGLSAEEVATQAQVVLGERMQEDPRVRTMVDGLSHGWVKMSEPHLERIAGTDESVKVWRGEFEDTFGNPFDPTRYEDPLNKEGIKGAFTLRPPQSAADHQSEMAQTMATTMSDSIERGDYKTFNEDLSAYMLGYVAKVQDFDGEGLAGQIPDRLMQSRTMLSSMTADGLSESNQKFAYSNAYVDAIEALQENYPEFGEQWNAKYGQDWQDFMRSAVIDPQGAHAVWSMRQEGSPTREHDSDYSRETYDGPEADNGSEPEPEFQA